MKVRLILFIAILIFLGGFGGPAVRRTAAALATDEGDGTALYASYCAGCHGDTAQGGYGPALTDLEGHSEADLFQAIAQGLREDGMPAFGETLSNAQIEVLVAFIRNGPSEGASEGGQATEETTGAVTAAMPTNLNLNLSQQGNGVITIWVDLQSGDGQAVPDAPIALYRRTVMGGSLPVAETTTDAGGKAMLQLTAVRGQTLALEAVYAGDDGWASAKAQDTITLSGTPILPQIVSGLTSPTPPPIFAAILVVVIGGVWATYGYVIYQLIQIATQRKER